jgi:hypothetical protein
MKADIDDTNIYADHQPQIPNDTDPSMNSIEIGERNLGTI